MKRSMAFVLPWLAGALCAGGWLMTDSLAAAGTLWVDSHAVPETADGSRQAPFATITAAAAAVQPGDVVIIRGGTYRENVRLPSGEPEQPVTLRAAEGERVILSGGDPIGDWQPAGENRWSATLKDRPARVLLDGSRLPPARLPQEGWWQSTAAQGNRIRDPEHLRGLDAEPTGGEVYVWLQRGNIFKTFPIRRLDTQAGEITLAVPPEETGLSDGDKYWLQHRAEWLQRPGQWSVEPQGDRWQVSVALEAADLLDRLELVTRSGSLLVGRNVHDLVIEGLHLQGAGRDGIELTGAQRVTVRRCVACENGRNGITVRDVEDGLVEGCVAWRNGSGISVSYSDGVTVKNNDVGYNDVDGILVTWQSRNVTVRANCSHHHLLWGHPDNVQTYRDVENVTFEDNLLLAGGQSVMMEETRNVRFEGNMIVGCGANMLIFGHNNAGHADIVCNTLACPGYSCMSLTWEDYRVRENVFFTGHTGIVYGVRGISGYEADRNLFWGSARASNPRIMATDAGWLSDWNAVVRSSGEGEHSLYADPQFVSAPVAYAVLDHRRLTECTHHRLYLRGHAELFRSGDRVELNFDGVLRRVKAVEGDALIVEPPLAELPIKSSLVANWGETGSGKLDLRLSADSPGAALSASEGPIGSQIDIQAYLAGDFDGDRRRDRAATPRESR